MPESFPFPVYSGLLIKEHREKIGQAIWEFLWCISKITEEVEENGEIWGIVYGGKPVKLSEIADDLGISERQVKRNMARLKEFEYVQSIRAPYGEILRVRKSKKFIKRRDKNGTSESERQDKNVPSETERRDINVLSREDIYVPSQREVTEMSHPEGTDMSKRSATYVPSNKDIKDIKKNTDGWLDGIINIYPPDKTEGDGVPASDGSVHEISPSDLKRIEDHYLMRRGYGFALSPKDFELMQRLLLDKIPVEEIIAGIDHAFDHYEPKYPKDRIRHFAYCEAVIRQLHYERSQRKQAVIGGARKDENDSRQRGNSQTAARAEEKPITGGKTGWLRRPSSSGPG